MHTAYTIFVDLLFVTCVVVCVYALIAPFVRGK